MLLAIALPQRVVAADGAAWERLTEARARLLADGPLEARFEQSFQPAGFETVDTEVGKVSLRLPSCMRWDYDEPFPKTYLLCDGVAWSWNPGDTAGLRQRIDAEGEPGLDLLLVDVETLERRYRAKLTETPSEFEISLEPRDPAARIVSASLWIDRERRHVSRIRYIDLEGNTSGFELEPFAPFTAGDRFGPPAAISWEEP